MLGTTALGDLYQTANLVPNILFELFAAGSVQAVMVPALVAADERGHGAPALANAVLGWLLATLGALTAVALVATPALMALLTAAEPDAELRADKAALGSRFLAIFLVQLLFYAVGLVATALLQARRHFAAPAVAPLVNNLVVIGAYLLFAALRGGEPPSLSLSALELAVLAGGTTLGVVAFTAVPVRGRLPDRRALATERAARPRRRQSGPGRRVGRRLPGAHPAPDPGRAGARQRRRRHGGPLRVRVRVLPTARTR